MTNILSAFKSKRVLTIIALVIINGLASVHDQIPEIAMTWLNPILGLLGIYFGVPKNN